MREPGTFPARNENVAQIVEQHPRLGEQALRHGELTIAVPGHDGGPLYDVPCNDEGGRKI